MHSYTVNDVLSDDFNLSLLEVEEAEIARIKTNIFALRAKMEADKKVAATKSGQNPSYIYLQDTEVLQAQTILNNHHILSMLFSQNLMARISSIVYGDSTGSRLWVSWAVSNFVNSWLMLNPSISKKVLLSPTAHESVKHFLVNKSVVNTEDLIQFVKMGISDSLPENIQHKILELANPEDCTPFLTSSHDKVKLFAYKKLGPMKYLDQMISDPHAMIRSYAISIISPGDSRLAGFIDDRSEYIFCEALSKISADLIPMMLGSRHLKKKRAKGILNQRLAG